MDIRQLCENAGNASVKMAELSGEVKNNALSKIADALLANSKRIIEANQHDLLRSEKENLASPLLKRLKFDEKKLNDVVEGIKSLKALEEPVGKTIISNMLDDGLELFKVTCNRGYRYYI